MPKCSKKRRSSVASTALMRWSGNLVERHGIALDDAALADLVAVAVEEGDGEIGLAAPVALAISSKAGIGERQHVAAVEMAAAQGEQELTSFRPLTQLDTHDVFNQAPVMEESEPLFRMTSALCRTRWQRRAARRMRQRLSGAMARKRGIGRGDRVGLWRRTARRRRSGQPMTAIGQRIDEVRFHPAYHQLMALGLASGFRLASAWDGGSRRAMWRMAAILFLTRGRRIAGTYLPDDHDLCCRPGAARTEAAGGGRVGRRASCCRAVRRRLRGPASGKGGRHHWHGDDRKAGRLRRARQHAPAPEPAGEEGWYPPDRPQMVLFRPHVRRLPDIGLCRRRADLLPVAALAARRRPQCRLSASCG
jgi:hypothetical protein